MKFALDLREPMSDNLRRLAIKQLDAASRALERGARDVVGSPAERAEAHERVHDARKHIKKTRSVLRLFRAGLGDTYASENAQLRDTARTLSAVRDATALVEAIDALAAADPEVPEDAAAQVRTELVRRRDASLGEDEAMVELLRSGAGALAEARDRAESWTLAAGGLEAIERGFARIYRQARRAMRDALEGDLDARHEWRKRSKYHLHHVRLVAPVCPEWAEKRTSILDSLTDALGDERDLWQLAAWLEDRADAPERSGLLAAAERQRKGHILRAEILGARLFVDRAKKLRGRLAKGWKRRGGG